MDDLDKHAFYVNFLLCNAHDSKIDIIDHTLFLVIMWLDYGVNFLTVGHWNTQFYYVIEFHT